MTCEETDEGIVSDQSYEYEDVVVSTSTDNKMRTKVRWRMSFKNPLHCKKLFAIFPSPAGMSLINLSLDGNNLIIPAQGEFSQ